MAQHIDQPGHFSSCRKWSEWQSGREEGCQAELREDMPATLLLSRKEGSQATAWFQGRKTLQLMRTQWGLMRTFPVLIVAVINNGRRLNGLIVNQISATTHMEIYINWSIKNTNCTMNCGIVNRDVTVHITISTKKSTFNCMIWRVPVLNIISKWVPAVERTQSMEGRLGQSRVAKQWDEAASQSVSCTNMFPLRQKYTGCQSNPNRNVSGRACGHFWGCHHALTFVSGRKPNLLFFTVFLWGSAILIAILMLFYDVLWCFMMF